MPYPPLNNKQMRAVIRMYLKPFNDEEVKITNDTKHNEVLSPTDGPIDAMSSKFVYYGLIRWKLTQHGQDKAKWPANWMSQTVTELAGVLVPEDES
jgi:hypothetical protein